MGKKGTPKYTNEFEFDAVRLVVEEGLTQADFTGSDWNWKGYLCFAVKLRC